MAEGVDVSRHQGNIDWAAARAGGIAFAYIKVTEGVGWVDPRVHAHLGPARQAGVVVGLYHFARPDTNSGVQDAEHFAAEVNARGAAGPGNLPPCLDLEERTPGSLAGIDLVAWVADFLAAARRITGRRQFMLYGSAYVLRDRLGGLGWLDRDCLVWVAHYGRAPGDPGWRDARTVMHQYTSTGRINGYGANIDRNTCWVDLATLTAGGGVPHQPPVPPPQPEPDIYVVKPGDTLSEIAQALNYPGGWRALYEANRNVIGPDPNKIIPGQRLRIAGHAAPPSDETYVVQPGEDLSQIARDLGVPGGWRAIWNANHDTIADPDLIYPGQRLRIPR